MHYEIEYDWLVIVFVHEIVEDITQSRQFVDQIERASHNTNSLVFLVKDTYLGSDTLPGGEKTFTFMLSLSRLEMKGDGSFRFIPVEGVPIYNPDKHCWETAFNYIYANFRARRRMLLTLSHGAGLGINGDAGTVIRPVVSEVITNPYYFLDRQDVSVLSGPSFTGIDKDSKNDIEKGLIRKDPASVACRSLEILWISELRDALVRCLGSRPIDLLVMVNCNMQLFDAGFMLSKNVRYLVAPEGSVLAPGYDYGRLFALISQDPTTGGSAIAKSIVYDYKELSCRIGDTFTSLFANSLEPYPLLLAVFKEFVGLVTADIDRLFPSLFLIREKKVAYVSIARNNPSAQSQDLIDLGQWMRLVASWCTDISRLADLYSVFENILNNEIVQESAVGSGYTDFDRDFEPKFGYSGLSIYYPLTPTPASRPAAGWCSYFDKKVQDDFRSASGWDIFLEKYFAIRDTRDKGKKD